VRSSTTSPARRGRASRAVVLGAVPAGALAVTAACSSSGSSGTSASPSASMSASATGLPTAPKDATLAAMVPSKLSTAGSAVVCTDASYAPNEFFATDNKTIIGMDVDLGHAIGQVLGVNFNFSNLPFDSIIPALGNRCDVGMSSFTDNLTRQKQVNFVDYFQAGTSFMQATAKPQTITGLDSICGMTVAVEKGTTEETDATTQSAACTKAGKKAVTVLAFPDQNGANLALTSGRAQIGMADQPVAGYQVSKSNGMIALVGNPYGVAPYGIALPKSADFKGLDTAIQGALQKLQTSGLYTQILNKWGVTSGGITTFTINGAKS
jgi:polar amino acid transport system substrate-binding protein